MQLINWIFSIIFNNTLYPAIGFVLMAFVIFICIFDCEGTQNVPLQKMPLWHIDYFELKSREK